MWKPGSDRQDVEGHIASYVWGTMKTKEKKNKKRDNARPVVQMLACVFVHGIDLQKLVGVFVHGPEMQNQEAQDQEARDHRWCQENAKGSQKGPT